MFAVGSHKIRCRPLGAAFEPALLQKGDIAIFGDNFAFDSVVSAHSQWVPVLVQITVFGITEAATRVTLSDL